MFVHSLRLGGFVLLLVDLIAIVNALPSNFLSFRDDLFTDSPKTEPSLDIFNSAPQDSVTSSSGLGLYSPEDSTSLLALASTQAENDQPFSHDFDQPGPDTSSTDDLYPAVDLGSTSEPLGLSLPDDTLGPSDTSSNQPTIASSTDLFTGDNPDGSISADLFAGDNPDGSSSIKSLAEDNSEGSIPIKPPAEDNPEGSISTLAYAAPDIPPSDPIGGGDGSPLDLAGSSEGNSFSDQGKPEDSLIALGKNAGLDRGTTATPECGARKTPACCSTQQSGRVSLVDFKSGCVPCTCILLKHLRGVQDHTRKPWA